MKLKVWSPVIGWALLMFVASSDALSAEHTSRFLEPLLRWLNPQISAESIAAIHFGVRKLAHLTEYAILAALLWRALRCSLDKSSLGSIATITFVIAAAFAASDEFHQSFVATRTPSVHDVVIDCCGAALAIALCWSFRRTPARRA